jgi:rhodanese-related sulfurtransferase
MKNKILFIFVLFSTYGFSQESIAELLKKYNTKTVPYISVQELAMPKTNAIILDAREKKEYNISHLKNAIHIGYNFFQLDTIQQKIKNKNKTIVVYCSLGIRSETIAKKLKKGGYTSVFNLYGGIFEWKNNNFSVYNSNGKETENVHTFNKTWGKWLTKGIKIID